MRRFLYAIRCRLGAWLLREHIGALCLHYDRVATAHKLKGSTELAQRCSYIGIGLRYAAGNSTQWRRFDDEQSRLVQQMREQAEHARDPL